MNNKPYKKADEYLEEDAEVVFLVLVGLCTNLQSTQSEGADSGD